MIWGECDTWEWVGTAKQLEEIRKLQENPEVASIYVEGGVNFAESVSDFSDGAYDPWVAEWRVTLYHEGEEK